MSAMQVDELVLADAHGVWAVRSASETVYFLDLDSGSLLREPGAASSRGPGDGRWVPLVSVESSAGARGVVTVGLRHKYVFDWNPHGAEYGYWIQRTVTSIDYVEGQELAALPRFVRGDRR